MIKVENYHKAYKETIAVSGLSFEVSPGSIMGMVGPNGAGKTTTLRAIAGIIPPTQGQISISGFDISEQPKQAKKNLAYIPDEPRLFDALTVWEHLRFSAAAYGVDHFESIGDELLDQFELTDRRDTPAQALSRGMRQKVAICCAYLHNPGAILFDEPHTGLDPHAIRTMKKTVEERAEAGAAVIVSSHMLSLIEDTCTHLLILLGGKAAFQGTFAELRSQYPDLGDGSTLEDIFFRATRSDSPQQDASPLPSPADGDDDPKPEIDAP
jgi:ABC-2 type transport system ATP-binding protein